MMWFIIRISFFFVSFLWLLDNGCKPTNVEHVKAPLENYMAQYPKVKIVRLPKREGLIRARLLGLERATAPVVTYLDSHCECTEGQSRTLAPSSSSSCDQQKRKTKKVPWHSIDPNSLSFCSLHFSLLLLLFFLMFYFIRLHGTDLISKALSVGARPTACPMKKDRSQSR